jgi:dihydroorotase
LTRSLRTGRKTRAACRCVGIVALLALVASPPLTARQDKFDLLLTGGHVIDPGNEIDGIRDVGIRNGRVARVAASIPAASAAKTVDVKGLYVVPGLVDIHSHQYGYSGALFPDDVALPAGTTTVVDAGGPGWKNFEDYREKILRRAKTRVLTFINIVGLGMGGNESDVADMDPQATAKKISEYPDLIVGIKNAHFGGQGFVSVERAVEAGRLSNRPVILDNNILSWTGRDTRTKVLEKMRTPISTTIATWRSSTGRPGRFSRSCTKRASAASSSTSGMAAGASCGPSPIAR